MLPAMLLLVAHAALDRGEALLQAGRTRDAHALFQQVARDEPQSAPALAYLGLTTLQVGRDVDSAIALLERAVALDPAYARAHLFLGAAYGEKVQRGSIFTAMSLGGRVRDHLHRAVDLAPGWVEAHEALLQFCLAAPKIAGGGIDRAREEAVAITRLDRARGLLADAAVARKEGRDPLPALRASVDAAAEPADALEARLQLGRALLEANRGGEAVEQFHAAATLAPERAAPHAGLGDALLATGASGEALATFRRAVALDPFLAGAWLGMGEAAEKQGLRVDARKAYTRYLELQPDGDRASSVRQRLPRLVDRG